MGDKGTIEVISPINCKDLDEKKNLILSAQTSTSRQLALHVIEKPIPRVWMIFIPILFVFYFMKLKEYESALKNFAEHHLLPWHRTLEAAFTATVSGRPVDISPLVEQIGHEQEETRIAYTEWLTLLAGHFQLLLSVKGDSYPDLVRAAYQDKTNYASFCQQLDKIEARFNLALLETIEGDSSDLSRVTKAMTYGMTNLRVQETDKIFN